MSWMVTGGAGYIGAHVVRALSAAGHDVVVVDDLSSGHASFVPDDVSLHRGSVLDIELLARVLRWHHVTGVVHLAGFKYAGVSVDRPLHTYEQNVEGTRRLLLAMHRAGVHQIVFSSSAAVFGTPDVDLVTEDTPTLPESPYGESKLIGEWLLRDVAKVIPLRHTSLRYFNVVGSAYDDVYDTSPHNLVPLVLKALTEGRTPRINGDDYPTPDGTCVRDYLHVGDLADAHVAAAEALAEGRELQPVYNLGSGDGMSVARDHGLDRPRHRHRLHPRDAPAPPRRPGPDRRERRGRDPRPRLADVAQRRRDDGQRLEGLDRGVREAGPLSPSTHSRSAQQVPRRRAVRDRHPPAELTAGRAGQQVQLPAGPVPRDQVGVAVAVEVAHAQHQVVAVRVGQHRARLHQPARTVARPQPERTVAAARHQVGRAVGGPPPDTEHPADPAEATTQRVALAEPLGAAAREQPQRTAAGRGRRGPAGRHRSSRRAA